MKKLVFIGLVCLAHSPIALSQVTELNLIATMTGRMTTSDGANHTYWGFGYPSMPPTIQLPGPMFTLIQGQQYKINFTNNSMEDHTVHLHGLDVDQANDGFPETSFSVRMGRTGSYEFTAPHAGTYWYHCHVESFLHAHMGMWGAIIVRPPDSSTTAWEGGPSFDVERMWIASEFDSLWLRQTMDADFKYYRPKYFMINGKEQSGINGDPNSHVAFSLGDTVLLRLLNAGYMVHRYDFANLGATIIASDGRPLPSAIHSSSLEVLPGERYDVLITANTSGLHSISVEFLTMYNEMRRHKLTVPVQVTGPLSVSAIETPRTFDFTVYPNPLRSSSKLSLKLVTRTPSVFSVVVYDLLGRKVRTLASGIALESGTHDLAFELNGLRGSSFIEIRDGVHVLREMIVVE